MASATTRSASGTGGQVQGGGLITFAAVLLVIIGCFNLIYAIAAIAHSHVFTANAHYVFANLRTWGWVTLISACCSCWRRPGSWRATSWPAGSR